MTSPTSRTGAPIASGGATPLAFGSPRTSGLQALLAAAVMVVTIGIGVLAFIYLKREDANKGVQVLVAVIVGGVGIWAVYWAADKLVSALPGRTANAIRPVIFVGPAISLLAFYLVYPAISTIVLSLRDRDNESWNGLDNFQRVLTERNYLLGIRNSAIWVLLVPLLAVAIGLAFATLADKLGSLSERISKSIIFMPMVISFVGASIVFLFIYSFRPAGFGEQIGLLNALWTQIGGEPKNWLTQTPWNNLYLMVILVWLQTGFAMVILSSAIKGVPEELLEAARIDGATEWQAFWRIVFPTISSTVVVVWTTIVITVWKVFDIVYVMTGGTNDTQVIAQQMYREYFDNDDSGTGAALAVLLFIAVLPILIVNVRRFKAQEAIR